MFVTVFSSALYWLQKVWMIGKCTDACTHTDGSICISRVPTRQRRIMSYRYEYSMYKKYFADVTKISNHIISTADCYHDPQSACVLSFQEITVLRDIFWNSWMSNRDIKTGNIVRNMYYYSFGPYWQLLQLRLQGGLPPVVSRHFIWTPTTPVLKSCCCLLNLVASCVSSLSNFSCEDTDVHCKCFEIYVPVCRNIKIVISVACCILY